MKSLRIMMLPIIICLINSACSPVPKETPTMTATTTNFPTASITPSPTASKPAPPTLTATITPTATITGTPTVITLDWPRYVSTEYGFSFAYPLGWEVSKSGTHFIRIGPPGAPSIRFTIGVKHTGDATRIGRTGVPEGDIFLAGNILFLGQEISKGILKYQGNDKLILYANGVEIKIGELIFTLGLGDINTDYGAVNLSLMIEETADAIVESFALTK